jgi:hypothetical protein
MIEFNSEYDAEKYEAGKKTAEEIVKNLNCMGREDFFTMGFMEELSCTHRTLQQKFGGVIQKIIFHFAEEYSKGRYDPRNEAFCKMCHELKSKVEEAYLPFI